MDIISKENGSGTFLSILYDKNNVINKLREQLENQKLQILYYMKRELNYTKMIDLSRTCRTENTEDNLPVVLAFAQFTKQNGMKSTILRLYEHMKHIDRKLYKYLNTQEFIVRKISEKLCQLAQKPKDQQITLQQTTNQAVHLDLFIALLDVTIGLQQKLDSFRICCNRLILIEDERNNIVEQVINFPVQERIHCNMLISMKHEIMDLKSRMKEIKEHKGEKKEDLKKINCLDEDLTELNSQIKSSIKGIEDLSIVEDMVGDLQLETKKVLEANRKQQKKRQYQQTEMIVNLIKLAAIGGNLHTNNEDQLIMFGAIQKEVQNLQSKFTIELQVTKTEHECTKCKLKTILQERNELKLIESKLQDHIKMIQKNHDREIASLKKERDIYLSQVEYLNIVREAFDRGNETLNYLERQLCSMNETIQNDFIDTLKHKKNKCIIKELPNLLESNSSYENFEITFPKDKLDRKTIPHIPASSSKVMNVVKKIKENLLKDKRSNKKRNLSSLSLEIKLRKQENKVESCSCNELNQLCDCSCETIPVYYKPINKNNDNTAYGPSNNIELLVVNNNMLHSSSDDFSFPAL